jgi:hypothetical protein
LGPNLNLTAPAPDKPVLYWLFTTREGAMVRGVVVIVFMAGAFLIGPVMLPSEATNSPVFAQGERHFVLPHVFDSKREAKPGKKGAEPAGLAVSDPGASGTKKSTKRNRGGEGRGGAATKRKDDTKMPAIQNTR